MRDVIEREPLDGSAFGREMRSVDRPSKEISFPHPYDAKKKLRAKLVRLHDEEIAAAAASATEYLTKGLKLDEYRLSLAIESSLYQDEVQRQQLVRALRDPADVNLPFADIDDLRSYLDPDTRLLLMRQLAAFTRERSPITEEHDPKVLLQKVRDLKKADALSDWLLSCDFDTVVSIAISLADQRWKQTKQNSSDSSSSNSESEPSSETTEPT